MKKKLFALALVLVLSLTALCAGGCKKEANPLLGSWKLDAATVYVFEKDGKGSMNLPLSQNPFTYTIEENTVSIDFEDESMTDRVYTFLVDGDVMILTFQSLGSAEDVSYTFTRVEK